MAGSLDTQFLRAIADHPDAGFRRELGENLPGFWPRLELTPPAGQDVSSRTRQTNRFSTVADERNVGFVFCRTGSGFEIVQTPRPPEGGISGNVIL